MPNRYFTQDPRVSGPLEFLAAFGIQRQNVHAQEAGMQQQQDVADSRSLQSGMGALTSVFDARAGRTQQTAMEQLRQAGRLAEIGSRGAEDRHSAALNELMRIRGETPPGLLGPGGGVPTPSPPVGQMGPPAAANIGQLPRNAPGPQPQQAQPPIPKVPLAVAQPEMIGQVRQAEQRLQLLTAEGAAIQTDPRRSPEDRAQGLAALTPEIASLRSFLNRNPRPKRPVTFEELVAAGPMNGGVAAIPGTSNFLTPDGKGGVKVSTAIHPDNKAPWLGAPTPELRNKLKQEHLNTHRVEDGEDEYLWDGKKWEKQKPAKDGGSDRFDLSEFVIKATSGADGLPVEDALGKGRRIQEQLEIQDQVERYDEAASVEEIMEDRAKRDPTFGRAREALREVQDRVSGGASRPNDDKIGRGAAIYMIEKLTHLKPVIDQLDPAIQRQYRERLQELYGLTKELLLSPVGPLGKGVNNTKPRFSSGAGAGW